MKHWKLFSALLILLALTGALWAQTGPHDVDIRRVANMAALRATVPGASTATMSVYLLGYHTPGDGGGGQFVWKSLETSADDGGICIKATATSGAGRWIRCRDNTGLINVRWFGAKGDNSTDDVVAIKNAMATTYVPWGVVYVPTGRYRISSGITIATGAVDIHGNAAPTALKDLTGDGRNKSWLILTATSGPAVLAYAKNCKVSNLGIITLDDDCNGVEVHGRHQPVSAGTLGIHLENLYFATWGHAIDLKSVGPLTISNCADVIPFSGYDYIDGLGASGTFSYGTPDTTDIQPTSGFGQRPGKNFINALLATDTDYPGSQEWVNAILIEKCHASGYDFKVHIIASSSASGISCNNITLRNNCFQSSFSTIKIGGFGGGLFQHVTIEDNYLGEGAASGPIIWLKDVRHATIRGNIGWQQFSDTLRGTKCAYLLENTWATIEAETIQDLLLIGDGNRITLNQVNLYNVEVDGAAAPNTLRNLRGSQISFDGYGGRSYLDLDHNGNWVANYPSTGNIGFPWTRAGDREYFDPAVASSSGRGYVVASAPSWTELKFTTVISPGSYTDGLHTATPSVKFWYHDVNGTSTTEMHWGWVVCTKGGPIGEAEVTQYYQKLGDATWTLGLCGVENTGSTAPYPLGTRTVNGTAFSFRFNSDSILATGDAWISTLTPRLDNTITGGY